MGNSVSARYVTAVAQHLSTRLHTAQSGFRCRCGQCRHLIAVTATQTGIPVSRLQGALDPEREPVKDGRRAARRRPLTTQVVESMTVIRGGRTHQGIDAVQVILAG